MTRAGAAVTVGESTATSSNTLLNVGLFVLLALMLGGSYPLTEVALRGFDPVTLVLIRLLIGAMFISVWMVSRAQPLPRARRTLLLLTVLGLLNTFGSFLLVTWGQKYVTASFTAILLATNPIFAAIGAAAVIPNERLTPRRIAGVLIGFAGVVVLFSHRLDWSGGSAHDASVGAVAIMGGAVALAIVAVTVRARLGSLLPTQLAFPMLVTGAVAMSAFEGARIAGSHAAVHVQPSAWPIVATALLGVVNAGIGNVMYYTLIRAWGVTRTALVGYLVPFVGVALGAAFLHDPVRANMLAGLLLITTSLVFVNPLATRAFSVRA